MHRARNLPRQAIVSLCLQALAATSVGAQSLSFSEGAKLARERSAIHVVFVHGSDWNLFGEHLRETVWESTLVRDSTEDAGMILSDVDVLQNPDEAARSANERRNAGWKGTGLVTYPAFIALDAQGELLGSRQGLELPRDASRAKVCVLEFVACLRLRGEIDVRLAAARAEGDARSELALLLSRDGLPLERAPDLLERLRAMDTDEARSAAARIDFPDRFELVRQATSKAAGGEGAETERRLHAMLAEPAYTDEQRATVWFALGGAYRRWEGHAERAGEAFRAAWKADPEGLTGTAGRRMYLELYAGPSLAFGWAERHGAGEPGLWVIEDLPPSLAPGTWRLRWSATEGDAPRLVRARVVCGERVIGATDGPGGEGEVLFVLDTPLENGVLRIERAARSSAHSRGSFEWEKVR
ncbi:MAG: hypothetical protein CMJ84_07515 [Planctomycetes bacterium]|nr:hypothetical protein [Planctomycetota bacterium]